jgi:protein-disulfide isomerase-like protein with CxxC motif
MTNAIKFVREDYVKKLKESRDLRTAMVNRLAEIDRSIEQLTGAVFAMDKLNDLLAEKAATDDTKEEATNG